MLPTSNSTLMASRANSLLGGRTFASSRWCQAVSCLAIVGGTRRTHFNAQHHMAISTASHLLTGSIETIVALFKITHFQKNLHDKTDFCKGGTAARTCSWSNAKGNQEHQFVQSMLMGLAIEPEGFRVQLQPDEHGYLHFHSLVEHSFWKRERKLLWICSKG